MPSTPVGSRLLDALIAVLATLTLLAWIETGLRLPLGLTTVSISGPLRPALLLLATIAARLILARSHNGSTTPLLDSLTHRLLLAATLASLAYASLHLTTVSGGADSYGYVSAASLIRSGTLSTPQPDAAWLPADNAIGVLAPLGYLPSPDRTAIVPLYPLGFPALIAAVSTVVPLALAPYIVAPVMAAVVLALVFLIASRWTGQPDTAWLAVSLAAWDPLLITYAKQPMSDVPATAWLLLSIWCLVRSSPRPYVAGLAAGLSFLTRPGGVGAIAALGLLGAMVVRPSWRGLVRMSAGLVPCIALQAVLQWRLFGSPWASGYGALSDLYAGATLADNLLIYGRALAMTHLAIWPVLVVAGLVALDRGVAAWLVLVLGVSLAPYLLYFKFDHWETLRFVLPAVILLHIAAASGAVFLLRLAFPAAARPVAVLALVIVVIASTRTFLVREGVPDLMEQERRYLLTAEWVGRYTPAAALVIAGQHSGSLRHYGNRTTLRWDVLSPSDLTAVVREARRRGRAVYVTLDRTEQEPFRTRFSAALSPGEVTLLPGGQVQDVQIWELTTPEEAR